MLFAKMQTTVYLLFALLTIIHLSTLANVKAELKEVQQNSDGYLSLDADCADGSSGNPPKQVPPKSNQVTTKAKQPVATKQQSM